MSDLEWLSAWYREQCDGDWEHEYGVEIGTLDNPGWRLQIDLVGTDLSDVTYAGEKVDEGEKWYRLWREEHAFHGAGSPATLPLMVSRFRSWVTAAPARSSPTKT